MIDHAAIRKQAQRSFEASHLVVERAIAILKQPRLSELRTCPLSAHRTGASGDKSPLSKSPFDPSGSAVEAGRPANSSTPGAGCTCPVCTSDLADIAPCERENDQ